LGMTEFEEGDWVVFDVENLQIVPKQLRKELAEAYSGREFEIQSLRNGQVELAVERDYRRIHFNTHFIFSIGGPIWECMRPAEEELWE